MPSLVRVTLGTATFDGDTYLPDVIRSGLSPNFSGLEGVGLL
jgi:hypothetical protein